MLNEMDQIGLPKEEIHTRIHRLWGNRGESGEIGRSDRVTSLNS